MLRKEGAKQWIFDEEKVMIENLALKKEWIFPVFLGYMGIEISIRGKRTTS